MELQFAQPAHKIFKNHFSMHGYKGKYLPIFYFGWRRFAPPAERKR